MAKQYSHRQFFRQIPNSLLARYFQERKKVFQKLDFHSLKENDVETLVAALKDLSVEVQADIEAELQQIDGMACQGGISALTDEAHFHDDADFPMALAKIEGFHAKALWTYLEKNHYWQGGTFFLHSDNIAETFWKKRNHLVKNVPNTDPEAIELFERAISDYFYTTQGRGRNCKVEVLRRYGKEYFFAYPEDFAQSSSEWVGHRLKNQAHRPAFELIFVYSQAEGSLDMYAPRNAKHIADLQQLFARCILNIEALDPFAVENLVYDLDGLADKSFGFKIAPNLGIEKVNISRLRLSLDTGKKQRVSLETNPDNPSSSIYELLESLHLPAFHVTQVEMKVYFSPQPGKPTRSRRVKISYPAWCGLKHEGDDLLIREMLMASGIEPMSEDTGE